MPVPSPAPTPTLPTRRVLRWRADLRYLADELPRRHKNAFFTISQAEFRRVVAELDRDIPNLTDSEIVVRLMRIVASIGDAHTVLNFWPAIGNYIYPLDLYWFSDGLYVIRTTEPYRRALGARLVKIGNVDVEQARSMVAALVPHQNDAWLLAQSPALLTLPNILHALKLSPHAQRARFTFEESDNNFFTLEMPSVTRNTSASWLSADVPIAPPLYRRQPDKLYWYEYLPDTQLLYFQYNACRDDPELPFDQFAKKLLAFADTHPIRRFVVDLRSNQGGNSEIIHPLIAGLVQHRTINRRGRLFVLIGRQTFSSALMNAIELREQTAALLIGEPTGGKPNGYGEVQFFDLPNSHLTVQYSTEFFKDVDGDPPSLMPDISATFASADYFAGHDPALEAVLAYRE